VRGAAARRNTGRGVAVGLPADFAGELRPPGGAVDIGAYDAVPIAG
jgi:hypothetical protein